MNKLFALLLVSTLICLPACVNKKRTTTTPVVEQQAPYSQIAMPAAEQRESGVLAADVMWDSEDLK